MKQFLQMLAAHAYFDYAGQGDFMAKAKNVASPIPGVPYWQPLAAHAVMHGAAVATITGTPALGFAEAAVHAITDDLKCRGKLTYNQDQAIHVACKALWAIAARVFGESK